MASTPYSVIGNFNISKLIEEVNKEIAKGYIPIGGFVLFDTGGFKVWQTLYKPPAVATAAAVGGAGGHNVGDPRGHGGGSRRTRKVRRA